jgi:autophagy-related protein 17
LDSLLDDLGSQLVPPSFYETASGSSIFGSQASEKDLTVPAEEAAGATGTEGATREGKEDAARTKWKTLRFFVDERAIEEAIERMDDDRNVLEVRSSLCD